MMASDMRIFRLAAAGILAATMLMAQQKGEARLMMLEPGHFHAALLQKERVAGVAREAYIYAPLDFDLIAHLGRVARFNLRPEAPTDWQLRIYAGPNPLQRMLAEHPGNVVVLSGRNKGKIDSIRAALDAGIAVLGDKPWIIEPEDMPKLGATLAEAARRGVAVFDGMTQRFEISYILQKALVNDAEVFGKPVAGTPEDPGVYMESVHFLLKTVAGVANQRPPWFFDIRQQGEGLTDVGTHLVDLIQWTLTPEAMLDYKRDVQVTGGRRWPTRISPKDFERVTGEKSFPAYVQAAVRDGALDYYCNDSVSYRLKGVNVKLDVKWDFEPAPGANDTELAIYRGTRARVEVRQDREFQYRPEVFVVPEKGSEQAVAAAVAKRLEKLAGQYPGLTVEPAGGRLRVLIPDKYRVGHEAHFAMLTNLFFEYRLDPKKLPAWEAPFMLAKYYVTTMGVAAGKKNGR